jgi:peptide/nickel transport system permease protein
VSPLARLLLPRAAMTVLTLWVVSVIIFAATIVIPADPARKYLGRFAQAEQIAQFNAQFGLDRPLVDRYVDWAGGFLRGDLGTSTTTTISVNELLGPRLVNSALLGGLAFAITLLVALSLGLIAGRRPGSPADVLLSFGVLSLVATPDFVIGIVLLALLAVQLRALPLTSGAVEDGFLSDPAALVLPVLTLVLVSAPSLARFVRAAVREAIATPHVRAAALRGLSASRLTWGHVIPTAIGPIVNVVALTFAGMVSGALIVETVFAFPGAGALIVGAVSNNDVAVVQAGTMIFGALLIVLNFVSDAVVAAVSPERRRLSA